MKLVSFNIWGATIYGPLVEYLGQLSASTDIFCFQEVFSALPGAPKESSGSRMFLFDELKTLLPGFVGFFQPRSTGYDFEQVANPLVSHGIAVFVRKDFKVLNYRAEILEQSENPDYPVEGWTMAQVITLEKGNKNFSVINFHGVALPGNKQDTPQRISQMSKLKLVWQGIPEAAKILCGDFNLYPETQSVKILESVSRNLIKEFNIKNTRNEVSWKKHPDSKQAFADFTFVSEEVKVNSFEVPYNEVSDHLPMILEFNL